MKVSDELRQVVAEAIRKDFPVVKTGTDENGDWCCTPLDSAIFERAADAALTAAIPLILEEAAKEAQAIFQAGRAAERAQIREKLGSEDMLDVVAIDIGTSKGGTVYHFAKAAITKILEVI